MLKATSEAEIEGGSEEFDAEYTAAGEDAANDLAKDYSARSEALGKTATKDAGKINGFAAEQKLSLETDFTGLGEALHKSDATAVGLDEAARNTGEAVRAKGEVLQTDVGGL